MHVNKQAAKDMLDVKKQYLNVTIEAIRKQYGSVDNFLNTQIGLNPQQIRQLQQKYLQE